MKEPKLETQEISDSSLFEEIIQLDRISLGAETWKLTFGNLRPNFVRLLLEAVSFLNLHSDDYEVKIDGARNFGAGLVDMWMVKLRYTESKIRCVFNRTQAVTQSIEYNDEARVSERSSVFIRTLQARPAIRDDEVSISEVGSSGDSV